ncbi:MAG: DUF493 family protein [Bacteroidia bacterium]|nr:DUF493 family protein [Bacteroidia bacterium]
MAGFDFSEFAKKLEASLSFTTVYMFKFIFKSEHRTIALVENIFGDEAEIHTKESSGGKYIAITVKQVVMSVDEIISIYKKADEIGGVMSL